MVFRTKQSDYLQLVENKSNTTATETSTNGTAKPKIWRLFLIRRVSPKLKLFRNSVNKTNKKSLPKIEDKEPSTSPSNSPTTDQHNNPFMTLSKVLLAPNHNFPTIGSTTETENTSSSNNIDDDCYPPISQIQVQQHGDIMSVLMYIDSTGTTNEKPVQGKKESEPVCVDEYIGDFYSVDSKLSFDPNLLKEKKAQFVMGNNDKNSTQKSSGIKKRSDDIDNDDDQKKPLILRIVKSEEKHQQQNTRKSISVLTMDPALLQLNDCLNYDEELEIRKEEEQEKRKSISVLTMDPALLQLNEFHDYDNVLEIREEEQQQKRKSISVLTMDPALMQFNDYHNYYDEFDIKEVEEEQQQQEKRKSISVLTMDPALQVFDGYYLDYDYDYNKSQQMKGSTIQSR